jgi:hypothetical protein
MSVAKTLVAQSSDDDDGPMLSIYREPRMAAEAGRRV